MLNSILPSVLGGTPFDCSLTAEQVLAMSGTYISSGSNAVVKRIAGIGVFKQNRNEKENLGMLSRELCVLQRLSKFAWAPKIVCAKMEYMITTDVGVSRCDDELPADYDQQMASIVNDMTSVGVRQNDMVKYDSSAGRGIVANDVVLDERGRVSLTDFGWGTVDGQLELECNINGVVFRSPAIRRIHNAMLRAGFRNRNETTHFRVPCNQSHERRKAPATTSKPVPKPAATKPDFKPAGDPRSKRKVGTQKEVPKISFAANKTRLLVNGYQRYSYDLHASSPPQPVVLLYQRKFAYVRALLERLRKEERCRSMIDVGCSAGLLSLLGKVAGFELIVSLDHDPEYIDIVRRVSTWAHFGESIRPSEFSFGAQLPNPADVVICGALIHWVFCRTADFQNSFDKIFEYLLAAVNPGKFLVIEWVDDDHDIKNPKWWPQRCFQNDSRTSSGYSRAAFETAASRRATLLEQVAPEGKDRVFYVFRKHTITDWTPTSWKVL